MKIEHTAAKVCKTTKRWLHLCCWLLDKLLRRPWVKLSNRASVYPGLCVSLNRLNQNLKGKEPLMQLVTVVATILAMIAAIVGAITALL